MVTPPYLQAGDTIGIVSTARKVNKTELQPALDLLARWGLKVKLGESIGAEKDQFAGEDALRARDFQQMLDDEQIKAIWCARGGYGTVRIIDLLDFQKFAANPKWIIGYSDITVLHAHLNGRGVETLHAQMPLDIDKKTVETATSLKELLFGKPYTIRYTDISGISRNGSAEGVLVGGNLSVLYSLCGSASQLNTAGKILFLEDLDEYLYHVDRMLQNLKRNGYFNSLNGLIIGGLTDMNDNTIPYGKTAEEIVEEIVSKYNFPVCYYFPAGHVNDNRALIMGRNVQLTVTGPDVALQFTS
ncbi:LD-carboxypeptidase [Pukyongia salina]|uniref:LD-carboxypeptidase n=1 Tax=Pukyongia salina TaxID=2094025 RepID=A0A2S0HUW8_9FLAO|nr:LD-carboxypeptidase [Pukyongia salina]AVI50430.1 LD-carboxypeptidase [Pukyongia salina]